MRIVCVHGWAGTPTIWTRMNHRLKELLDSRDQLEIVNVDLGFFGDPNLPSGHFDVAIGHSFGLLWLLETSLITFDRLVSINGFTRFGAAEDFQSGWPHRIIKRMRKGLGAEKEKVLSEFLANAGADDFDELKTLDFAAADVERLDWALEALINGDGREQWCKFDGPQRVIAGTMDQIVSVEHSQQCFPDGDIQWLKSDCHFLPVKFPEICAALIREMIEVS